MRGAETLLEEEQVKRLYDALAAVNPDQLEAETRRAIEKGKLDKSEAREVLKREHPEMSPAELEQNFSAQIEQRITFLREYHPDTEKWDPPEMMGFWQADYVKAIAAVIKSKYGIDQPLDTQIVRITVESDERPASADDHRRVDRCLQPSARPL